MHQILACVLFSFLLPFCASASDFGKARFLHLMGTLPGSDGQAVLNALDEVFSAPLRQNSKDIDFSSIALTNAKGEVNFSLIVEPTSDLGIRLVEDFISSHEQDGFKGIPVKFQNVREITEVVTLQIGQYKPEDPEAFVSHFELSKARTLSSVHEWEIFNNHLGFSLLDKSEKPFLAFLQEFAPSPEYETSVAPQLLQNNMIEVPTLTSLVLEDGTRVGPQVGETPFLPFIYGRNCWSKNYENGNCGSQNFN